MEEVGGQQSGGLGSDEGAPVGVGFARCRPEACRGQDAADGAGADMESEAGELALDAPVSPARIVPCQANDEFAELVVDAGAAGRLG